MCFSEARSALRAVLAFLEAYEVPVRSLNPAVSNRHNFVNIGNFEIPFRELILKSLYFKKMQKKRLFFKFLNQNTLSKFLF